MSPRLPGSAQGGAGGRMESPPVDVASGDRGAALHTTRRRREEYEYFVRALSHDMTANFCFLEDAFAGLKRVAASQDREALAEHTARVEACLGQAKQFLVDLVGLAKTGTVDMEPDRVELESVVAEILLEQRGLLELRRVEVELRRPLPAVWCNRRRVKQILTNLIRNAVRHGCDADLPRITVSGGMLPRAMRSGAEGPSRARPAAWIRVHDNGPGIPAQDHEAVFLPGVRLPNAAPEGWGVGLAIVRKIAEYYGGAAQVDPEGRSGTAFLVTLPAVDVELPTVDEAPARDATTGDGRRLAPEPGHPPDDFHVHGPGRPRRFGR